MRKIRYYKSIKLEKIAMNCKLEKFWNLSNQIDNHIKKLWTVNLKSFEIKLADIIKNSKYLWTVNLKSFEIEEL